jgi:branched-chain amino acid transport system substrate-binding protein
MRKKTFGAMTAMIVVALVSAACSSGGSATSTTNGNAAKGTPIIVGFDVDQTGPAASYNVPGMQVSKAEINQVNAQGGIKGHPIQTIQCNDESDPTKVGACLQQLATGGAKFIIQLTGSPAVIQSKATVEQLQIPTISSTNATATVPKPPNATYMYTIGESTAVWGPAYCNGMVRAGIKTISLLEDSTPTIAGFTPPLLAAMPCVSVVNTQVAPYNATDISAEVARLASPKADAIFISTASTSFDTLANNQIKQQYPNATVFDVATLCNNPTSWKLANPGALVGTICPGSIDPKNKVTVQVQTALRKTLGNSFQLSQFTAEAWDGVNLMVKAMQSSASLDGPTLNATLETLTNVTSSFGSPGFNLTFSPTKHNASNGPCGLLMVQWNPDNTHQRVWPQYKAVGC